MKMQPQHVSLADLFSRRLFRIPQYQRAYSWQSKHRNALFDDIRKSALSERDKSHFMSTIVGLRRETRDILAEKHQVIELVDGQQRITTLILVLRAIAEHLDRKDQREERIRENLMGNLIKSGEAALILLQTNHDSSDHFSDYIVKGIIPRLDEAKTIADRELLNAMNECKKFVEDWEASLIDLYSHVNNNLNFILHEIDDENLVYTVFEVLNSRGIDVSWFDRVKNMLMAAVFETESGNTNEIIDEIHRLWGDIYEVIGMDYGLDSEALRFAATLWSDNCPFRTMSEEDSADILLDKSRRAPAGVIAGVMETTRWIKSVTEAVSSLRRDIRKNAVTKISHARLVAVAVDLRPDLEGDKEEILRRWESVTFRIYGMCNKDARTRVGDYVRLAWRIYQEKFVGDQIICALSEIGKAFPIEDAVKNLKEEDCYTGWQEELRYFLYRYEEHLAKKDEQNFDNEQWSRIWENSATNSIEHVAPQSTQRAYIHWLGNLLLLPPGLNSRLGARSPEKKKGDYVKTGLFIARQTAKHIKNSKRWGRREIRKRENVLLEWAKKTWVD